MKSVEEEEAEARGDVVPKPAEEESTAAVSTTDGTADTATTGGTPASTGDGYTGVSGARAGDGFSIMATSADDEDTNFDFRRLDVVEVCAILKDCFPQAELDAMMDQLYYEHGWYASEDESSSVFDSAEDERAESRRQRKKKKKKKKRGRRKNTKKKKESSEL